MTYQELLKNLKIPLKETSKNFVSICLGLARVFQKLQENTEGVLKRYFINKKDFEGYAKDRSITKIRNEEPFSHYQRTLNAYSFLKNSSTKQGIKSILKSFTGKNFEIRELYQENFVLGSSKELLGQTTILQSSLANYYFVVDFTDPLTVEEKQYLTEILELYKPAHIGFHLNARVVDDWKLGNPSEKLGINTYLEV